MQEVQRVDGGGIPDKSYDDSTREGGGDTTEKNNPGRGGWATDFPNDTPGKRRTVKLPSGRIPGASGDKDVNAGALLAPACH